MASLSVLKAFTCAVEPLEGVDQTHSIQRHDLLAPCLGLAQSCFVGPLPLELQLFELPVQLCKLLTRCLQILEELDLEVVVSLGTNSPAVHFNLHLADRLEQVGPLAFQVHLRLRDLTPQTIGGGSRYFILMSLPRVAKLARELRPQSSSARGPESRL